MKTSSKIALLILLIVASVAAFVTLKRPGVSPAAEAESRSPVPVHGYSADTRPTVEVYGDSIAQGDAYNFPRAESGPMTWVHYVGQHGVRFVGGFAQGGRTSESIQTEDRGSRSTFLLFALGTNDYRDHGLESFEAFAENARKFETRQHPDERFAVVTLGPMNDRPQEEIDAWNERLEALADEEGWILVNPWEGMRDDANSFVEGYNRDSFHPNEAGSKQYAKNLAEQLLAAHED